MLGAIVSFQRVVHYNQLYLIIIGLVAFITQLQLLHLLRYHKTISILGATLAKSLFDLLSFGFIMGVLFIAFACAIHLLYHDLVEYSTVSNTMAAQVRIANIKLGSKCHISFLHYRLKFALKLTHPLRKSRLRQISVYNVSTVTDSEKSLFMTNKKLTTGFPTSYRWSAYVTPKSPEGWLKKRFLK